MNVLDTIDTTITLEWAQTRTVATLVRLGARTATVAALRTPDVGTDCYLRMEGDNPNDSFAIDGTCVAVRDSEWGEMEVDVAIARVGTTTSATALRDFIDQHQIAKGGTVAVGKNRDNPEIKRFVYTLLPAGAELGQERRPSGERLQSDARTAERGGRHQAENSQPTFDSAEQNTLPLPNVRQPSPAPIAGLDLGDVDEELRAMLDLLDQRTTRPLGQEQHGQEQHGQEQHAQEPQPQPEPHVAQQEAHLEHDEDEGPILVEMVAPGDSQPRPVLNVPTKTKKGLVARLFGRDKHENPPQTEHYATQSPDGQNHENQQGDAQDPLSVWDKPVRQQQQGRGMVSGSLVAVQQLFSVDLAVRAERPVTFESGKKKRQGVAVRLAESKIRVRAPVMPALYERITIFLPAPRGGKDHVALRCEVTRIRQAEVEGMEQSFDAKLTGGNEPATMARLRQLMSEMQPAMGDDVNSSPGH